MERRDLTWNRESWATRGWCRRCLPSP
ncbi:hypothetical protein E2C01_080910 [Portunus trituberculatus]|uniref:Uncharacterized protein n=1 Tax=Portunus trituberculatus TaxID=210409 RepID=A0A5B7IUF1_PORTR|nr:hypothetical protein [Portunus trituberculatus]